MYDQVNAIIYVKKYGKGNKLWYLNSYLNIPLFNFIEIVSPLEIWIFIIYLRLQGYNNIYVFCLFHVFIAQITTIRKFLITRREFEHKNLRLIDR